MDKKKIKIVSLVLSLLIISFAIPFLHQRISEVALADLSSGIPPENCRRIPAGNYGVFLKTYAPIYWKVSCPFPDGNQSGEIPATVIPFGWRWIPTINRGSSYKVERTLEEICYQGNLEKGWQEFCRICSFIDCSKVKINAKLAVNRIECLLGAYRANGWGSIDLRYQNNGLLGSCSAKAIYNGRLQGIFTIVQPEE